MTYTYKFRRSAGAGGGERILPDVDQAEGVFSVVGDVTGTEEAPGGPIDWTGTISAEEYAANPTYFEEGVLVLVFDEETGQCFWGGEIDRPGAVEGDGRIKLHAKGHGAEPDSIFNDLLWETRDESRIVAGDEEPHEYDQDEQIKVDARTRGIRLGWEKKAMFLRATGETHLASDADKDDTSVSLVANSGGLNDNEEIHIGGETKHVDPSYSSGSTTVPLTSALAAKHKAGTHVYWRASGAPDSWASGALMWVHRDVNSVQYDLHLTRHAAAMLQLLRATGPDGSLTLVGEVDCSSGALDRTVEFEDIAGNDDLAYWRLKRTVQTDESGSDRAFWAVVHDIRVRDLAGNTSTYTVSDVVTDVVDAEDGEVANIETSSVNFMPLDGQGVSDAAILDEAALATNRFWWKGRATDGESKKWRFEPYGTRKQWVLTDPYAPAIPQVLPIWNVVQVPYKLPGGQEGFLTRRADPDPRPGETLVFPIDLDDSPPEDIAAAFASNAADMLATEEWVIRISFSWVEDATDPGVRVPGSKVRCGDTIEYDGRVYPVTKLAWAGDGVYVMDSATIEEGQTGRPALDKIILRRTLARSRGASQGKASLWGFHLDEPNVPANVTMGIKEIERRGGRRKFDAILDCDNVTEDINGKGTAIQRYVGIFEFQEEVSEDVWDWVLDDDGERMQVFRHSERQRSDDGAVIPAASRVILKNIPHPHKWKVVGRMFCVDVFSEKSHVSDATPAIKPAAFGPNEPEDLELRASNRLVEADWNRPDADENEGDDPLEPQLDNTVERFRAKCFRWESGAWVKKGKARKPRATHCQWRQESFHVGDLIKVEVVSLDAYGNESDVVSEEITIGNDPNHHHGGGSHTHPYGGGSHHHGHAGTHRHGKGHLHGFSGHHSHDRTHSHTHVGTHSHDRTHSHTHVGTHSHSKTHTHGHSGTHRHTWDHKHEISRHSGHGHSFNGNTHGHGGATSGLASGSYGSTHQHIISDATHDHNFVNGGAHAHGGSLYATDDAADDAAGTVRAADTSTMQLVAPGSTDSDSAATGTTAPGDTDSSSGNTGTTAPGSTDSNSGSTGTSSPGSTDSDTAETDLTAPGDTDDATVSGTSSAATGDTGDNVDD